jgi:hypothetical protein
LCGRSAVPEDLCRKPVYGINDFKEKDRLNSISNWHKTCSHPWQVPVTVLLLLPTTPKQRFESPQIAGLEAAAKIQDSVVAYVES